MVRLQEPLTHTGTTKAHHGRTAPVWPDAVTLREVLQNPQTALTADCDLDKSVIAADRFGFPLAYTGRFAAVFRLLLGGNCAVALRVFTSPDGVAGDRATRCERVAESLLHRQAVIGDLLPPFLFLRTAVRVGDAWYPAQVMPWADGEPLLGFVSRNYNNAPVLRDLAQTIGDAARRLDAANVSHGDLQHDNIMVRGDGRAVTLVDYDALYTPELAEFAPPAERGHPNYQHPRRAAQPAWGTDRFAFAVIRAGLLLVAADPAVWERFGGDTGEGIVFTAADLAHPHVSPVFEAACAASRTDPALAEAVADLESLCLSPESAKSRTTAFVAPVPVSVADTYPSRVSPTCAEEMPRPVSYLAPLRTAAFRRQEVAHFAVVKSFLFTAPPAAWLAWFYAWSAGGTKWPFLAYLFALLTSLAAIFLYLTWEVKRQHDALEGEAARLLDAERASGEQKRLVRRQLHRVDMSAPPEAWRERAHLRQALAQIPLSRALAEAHVSASVVRDLRRTGIATAAHLWQRHGFVPSGTDAAQAARLRAWLHTLEVREQTWFARENDPTRCLEERLQRLADESAKRRSRLAELQAERGVFPDASFAAFLRRMSLPKTLRSSAG